MGKSYRSRANRSRGVTKRTVRKLINKNAEKKMHFWLDNGKTGVTDKNITASPYNYNVNHIIQSNTQYGRTGSKCRMTGLYFRGYLKVPAITVPDEDDQVGSITRIVLYIKKQGVENLSASVVDSIDMNMYTVLYDKCFVLHSNGPGVRLITIKKSWVRGGKGLGLPLEWTPSSLVSNGTQTKNEMHMMLVSNTSSEAPSLTAQSRVWFTDG